MQRPARGGGDAKNEGMRYDGGKSKTFLCSGLDRFLVERAAEQSPQFHGQWSNDSDHDTEYAGWSAHGQPDLLA